MDTKLPILNPHIVLQEGITMPKNRRPGRPKGSRNIGAGRKGTVDGLLANAAKHEQKAMALREQARKLHESQGQQLKQSGA